MRIFQTTLLTTLAAGLIANGSLARANQSRLPVPAGRGQPSTAATPTNQPIAWADLGAKATAQYSGDGLAIFAAADGAVRLRCAFQRLEGEVTREGLWLTSTADGAAASRFRVVADYVGRDGSAMVALPENGVAGGEAGRARYLRRGLVEEYSVSVDGVRQDFVVSEPPGGAGGPARGTGAERRASRGGGERRAARAGWVRAETGLQPAARGGCPRPDTGGHDGSRGRHPAGRGGG